MPWVSRKRRMCTAINTTFSDMNLIIGPAAVDENATLTYVTDNIRLCSMERATPNQLLGLRKHYQYHQRFHFITLTEDFQFTLAYWAGIKRYDPVLSFNRLNIEGDTPEWFLECIDSQRHLPVELLVCSLVTYQYYKSRDGAHLDGYLSPINAGRLIPIRHVEGNRYSICHLSKYCLNYSSTVHLHVSKLVLNPCSKREQRIQSLLL